MLTKPGYANLPPTVAKDSEVFARPEVRWAFLSASPTLSVRRARSSRIATTIRPIAHQTPPWANSSGKSDASLRTQTTVIRSGAYCHMCGSFLDTPENPCGMWLAGRSRPKPHRLTIPRRRCATQRHRPQACPCSQPTCAFRTIRRSSSSPPTPTSCGICCAPTLSMVSTRCRPPASNPSGRTSPKAPPCQEPAAQGIHGAGQTLGATELELFSWMCRSGSPTGRSRS